MPDERLPKKVFYGEFQEGKRCQCGQKKYYKDHLKAFLKDFDIPNYVLGLHRGDQRCEVASTKEQLTTKKREFVKLKESAENTGPPADSLAFTDLLDFSNR